MIHRLQTFFNIRPDEARPVLLLAVYYFFITVVSVAGRSLSSGVFFSRVPNAESIFPLMLIPVTITTALTVTLYTRLARRVGLVTLLTLTGVFFAAGLLLLLPLISSASALIALYVWMEVLNIVMFFQFYIFAGTIFDTRQAKRTFGIMGVGGAVATVLSGLGLRPFISRFSPEAVLVVTVLFILLSLMMVWLTRGYMRAAPAPQVDTPQPRDRVTMGGYLRSIMLVLAATILVATIVDYQYKVIASRHFSYDAAALSAFYGLRPLLPGEAMVINTDEVELTAFFGSVSALVGVLQLGSRLFVVGPLLTRSGILAGLIALPLLIGVNSLLVLAAPVILSALLLKTFDQATRFTINETSMELLWVPVSPARRLAYKPFINGTVPSIMQGAAGVLIFVVVTFFAGLDVQVISLIVLGVVALWLPLAFRLRQGYVDELMASIEQHELALEDLDLNAADATIIAAIDRALSEGDDVERAFILGMIEDQSPAPWARTLNRLFHEEGYLIRQRILRLAAEYPEIIPDDELLAIIAAGPSDITDEAIAAASRRGLTEIIPLMEPHLSQMDYPEIRAAAARAVIRMDQGPVELARDALREMVESRNANENIIALNTLAALPTVVVQDSILRQMLSERSIRTRALILRVVENPSYLQGDYGSISLIAQNLEKPATRAASQRVLRNYIDEDVIEILTLTYRERSTSDDTREGIIETLALYPYPAVARQLISFMDVDKFRLYTTITAALLTLARQGLLTREDLAHLDDETVKAARAVYAQYRLLHLLHQERDEPLLTEVVTGTINRMLPALLKLSLMDVPHTQVESLIVRVQKPEPQHIANVLEILDNVLSQKERAVVLPLFEGRPAAELAAVGARLFADLPRSLDDEIPRYILHGDMWESLIGLDFALRNRRRAVLERLDWMRVPATGYNIELVGDYLARDPDGIRAITTIPALRFPVQERLVPMYSVLEKTIILKRVTFFAEIESRELFHIAQIAEERQYAADELIFAEGDTGDGLYIIVEGQVRVHQGQREIAVLGSNEAMGEMSLFDHLPRSASATTLTPTTTFRIAPLRLREVMISHPEIMEAIIRTLSLRLRAATHQVTEILSR